MMNYLIVFILALSVVAVTHAGYSVCPPNTYWSSSENKCVNCSYCPVNEIIRKPCSAFEDIRCGPFTEFNNFLQGEKRRQNHSDGGHHRKHGLDKSFHHNSDEYNTKISKRPDLAISQDVNPWRTIALSLIGIICTSVVLLLAVVIFIHYFKKQNPGYDKEVIYDTNEPGLTEVCYSTLALDYMQKTRPPHALWMYTPAYHKSQDYLLRCNQYLENEQSTPFAQPTDDAEDCVDPESHAADSECTTSDSQNRPECSARNISQNTCSCNNPSSDYVFFNPTQNEYLEK